MEDKVHDGSLMSERNQVLHPSLIEEMEIEIVEAEPVIMPVIIGGMVLDIHGVPSMPANPRSTTPGKVFYILGGVARNVSECISKLGAKPYMISAVGLDMAGNLLMEHWESAKLSIEGIQRGNDIETAVVCIILDANGELTAAVASVEAVEKTLTPEYIQQFKHNIVSAPIVMVDANLSPLALQASCQMAADYEVPIWFEPVSVAKSRRVASIANHITFASPNEDELIAMANSVSDREIFKPIQRDKTQIDRSVESLFRTLKPAICVLLEKGIEVLVVTLGSDGVFLCFRGDAGFRKTLFKRDKKPDSSLKPLHDLVNFTCPRNRLFCDSEIEKRSKLFAVHFPAVHAAVKRLTGAGDCLVGGTMASLCAGLDVMQSVAVGIAAAKVAVEAENNVPEEFSLVKIADDARCVYHDARVLFCQSML